MYVLSMYVNNGLHTYTVLDVINIHTRYNFVQYWCQRCCSFAGVNCQGCFSFLAPSLEAGGFCPAAHSTLSDTRTLIHCLGSASPARRRYRWIVKYSTRTSTSTRSMNLVLVRYLLPDSAACAAELLSAAYI